MLTTWRLICCVYLYNKLVDLAPCDNRCDWTSWGSWSTCSHTCGSEGYYSRSRELCCKESWTLNECLQNCDRDYSGFHESRDCRSAFCSNGGTYSSFFGCNCLWNFKGFCCESEKAHIGLPGNTGCTSGLCNWTPWESWGSCSVTCGGGGTQQRERFLCCPEGSSYDYCLQKCGISSTESRFSNRSCGDTCLFGGTIKPEHWGCDCLNRTFGHCCEEVLPGCLPFPTDVIFVLDSSASQTKVQFQLQLDFINKFIDHVNISFSEFQISVVTFSWDAKIEIHFNQSESRAVLKSLVRQIPFRPGITNTHEGLRMAIDVARNNERRKGMVSFTYVVVLTDGMSSNRLETKQAAKELKSLNIQVIAIGIGHQVSQEELIDISSPGDSKASSYVFSAGDFNALDTMLKQLVDVTCDECIRSYRSDVVFLIDNEDLSNDELQDTINAVTHIVRQMDHFGEDDGIRIGVVSSSTKLQTVLSLNEKNTLDEVLVLLQSIIPSTDHKVCEKIDPECETLNITISINYTLNEMEKNKREDARLFVVVLTSGRFHNVKTVEKEVSALRNKSFVKMFAIGPGLNVKMEGLLSLVNEASHVYVIKENKDLSNLDILQTEFSYNVCTKSDDQT